MRFVRSLTAISLVCTLGCGDDDRTAADASARMDAGPVRSDSGPTPEEDGGQPPADGGPIADGGPTGATGSIQGNVSRSASATPEADGVGPIYIAVFDQDPVTNRDSATLIGRVILEGADLSSESAAIPYMLDGIPPRPEPYYVSAFFDDDMNAGSDPATAGPDRGDLVTLMGLGSPQVTVPSASVVDYDIVLNTALFFDP